MPFYRLEPRVQPLSRLQDDCITGWHNSRGRSVLFLYRYIRHFVETLKTDAFFGHQPPEILHQFLSRRDNLVEFAGSPESGDKFFVALRESGKPERINKALKVVVRYPALVQKTQCVFHLEEHLEHGTVEVVLVFAFLA